MSHRGPLNMQGRIGRTSLHRDKVATAQADDKGGMLPCDSDAAAPTRAWSAARAGDGTGAAADLAPSVRHLGRGRPLQRAPSHGESRHLPVADLNRRSTSRYDLRCGLLRALDIVPFHGRPISAHSMTCSACLNQHDQFSVARGAAQCATPISHARTTSVAKRT